LRNKIRQAKVQGNCAELCNLPKFVYIFSKTSENRRNSFKVKYNMFSLSIETAEARKVLFLIVFYVFPVTGSEEKRTGRGHQRRPPRAQAALAGHQPAGGIRTSRNLKYPQV
jgi:hypothetical protein